MHAMVTSRAGRATTTTRRRRLRKITPEISRRVKMRASGSRVSLRIDNSHAASRRFHITWTDSQTMIPRSPYTPLPDNIDTTLGRRKARSDGADSHKQAPLSFSLLLYLPLPLFLSLSLTLCLPLSFSSLSLFRPRGRRAIRLTIQIFAG